MPQIDTGISDTSPVESFLLGKNCLNGVRSFCKKMVAFREKEWSQSAVESYLTYLLSRIRACQYALERFLLNAANKVRKSI